MKEFDRKLPPLKNIKGVAFRIGSRQALSPKIIHLLLLKVKR
ncbi:MAG: hypothetical protein V2I56_16460 [Desulfobacteraceae bacterium]|nr:hypothetical protein [Desulfobacteraceae bacterium]